jgi:hypothetical protein
MSKLKSLPREIWFGNLYYWSALETQNTGSGHQHGKARIASANAYILETVEGEKFSRALNGKYLFI